MAEVKAFRWKGPGVLHITGRPDKKLVVVPPYEPGVIEHGCIVKDPVNIAALGQERIASLIKDGQAETVNWTEQVLGFVRPDAPAFDAAENPDGSLAIADAQASRDHLQATMELEDHISEQLRVTAATLSEREKEAANAALRKIGIPNTPATRGGDAPAFAPAGPDIRT
jgi:hypothetical protein